MIISSAFLARHVTVDESGTINVLGAAMSWIGRREYPAPLGLSLVLLIGFDDDEADHQVPVHLEVRAHSSGDTLAETDGGFTPYLLEDTGGAFGVTVPLHFDMNQVQVPAPGRYEIEIRVGTEHRVVGFTARLAAD